MDFSWTWITPYRLPLEDCLSVPSAGIVYAISEDLVVKLPFEYLVPPAPGDDDKACIFYRDLSLRSFEVLRNESNIYHILAESPHPNITRKLFGGPEKGIVLERITNTLSAARGDATPETRYQWILELVSALSWLEDLGFTHGDIAVRNILIDQSCQLKLTDFDSAIRNDHEYFRPSLEQDHIGLATCLHYILSGVDPIASAGRDFRAVKQQLQDGTYIVHPEADILGDIIQSGWTGHLLDRSYALIEQDIICRLEGKTNAAQQHTPLGRIFVQVDRMIIRPLKRMIFMEAVKTELERAQPSVLIPEKTQQTYDSWLQTVKPDPRWKNEEEYRFAWKAIGMEGTKGEWST